MKRISKIPILLFLILHFSGYSQDAKTDSSKVLVLVKHSLNDAKDILVSPTQWDEMDMLIASSLVTATGAFIAFGDQPVFDFANKHHSENLDRFFTGFEPMGHTYPLAIAGGFALHGLIAKNNYSFETGLVAVESFLLASLITQGIKITAGRQRPNEWGTTTPHQWEGPFFKGTSFCSGHTTAAFATASVIAYRYKHKKWVPFVAYGMAALGGLERIYDNRHWSSDVIMGAAIGTATGVFLAKQWGKNPFKIYPEIGAQSTMLTATISW